jgi:RNA polymerase sigma-70 factor (ECF subfamily)
MPVDESPDAVLDMCVDTCELVGRVAAGDRNALESLYHSYYRRLASFLSRSIGSSESVEEIINETFIEVWRGAKDSREASLVAPTWMFGIAFRKALEYLCQQKSRAVFSNAPRPLEQGLGTMSFEQRSTLVLAYQMRCSLEQIAAITSVPIGTVKARMVSAREKVRCFLPAVKDKRIGGDR